MGSTCKGSCAHQDLNSEWSHLLSEGHRCSQVLAPDLALLGNFNTKCILPLFWFRGPESNQNTCEDKPWEVATNGQHQAYPKLPAAAEAQVDADWWKDESTNHCAQPVGATRALLRRVSATHHAAEPAAQGLVRSVSGI